MKPIKAWLDQAAAAFDAGDATTCLALCRRILGADKKNTMALEMAGYAAAALQDFAAAKRYLELLRRVKSALSANTLRILATAYRALDDHAKFVALYREAAQTEPHRWDVWNDLGVALMRGDAVEESVKILERTCAMAPKSPEAHLNRGNALRAAGRLEDAEQAFRCALDLRPGYVSALANLAVVKRFKTEDDDLNALLRLEKSTSEDIRSRTRLSFAIAKAFEDLDDADRAFPFLERANSLRRTSFKVNPTKDIEEMRVWSDAFSNFTLPPNEPAQPDAPIFIVGMPRSGTTLVESIVAAHPDVAACGERHEFRRFTMAAAEKAGKQPAIFWSQMRAADCSKVAEDYLNALQGPAGNAKRFTDKMPYNFLYLPVILRSFPNATILHCRRNAMATCFSIYQQDFQNQVSWAYDQEEIATYYTAYHALMQHWSHRYGDRYITVDYEDVIGDIEGQARRVIGHCGLDWHEDCLAFEKSSHSVITASAVQVRQGLNTRGLERWRRYLGYLRPMENMLSTIE